MTGIVVRDRGNGTYDIDRGGEDIVEGVEGSALTDIGVGAQEVAGRDKRGVSSRASVPMEESGRLSLRANM